MQKKIEFNAFERFMGRLMDAAMMMVSGETDMIPPISQWSGKSGFFFIEHPSIVITGGTVTTDKNGNPIQKPDAFSRISNRQMATSIVKTISRFR